MSSYYPHHGHTPPVFFQERKITEYCYCSRWGVSHKRLAEYLTPRRRSNVDPSLGIQFDILLFAVSENPSAGVLGFVELP
jgi:hypothetical protein